MIVDYLKDKRKNIFVHTIFKDFLRYMESINPYFSEEISYGYTQKITTAKAIFFEQLHYELLKMYKKQPFNIEDTVKAKVLPVITSVLETGDERGRLTEAINNFKEIVAEEFVVNDSLMYLKEFLDSVKVFLYIMSTPIYDNMLMRPNSIMEQFADIANSGPYNAFLPVTRRIEHELPGFFSYMDLKDLVLKGQIDEFIREADRIYGEYDDYYDDTFGIGTFQQAAYLQLFVIVQNDAPVKICRYCKKLFIPKTPQSKYCQYVFDPETGDRCCDMVTKDKNDFWHTSEVYKRKRRIDGRFDSRIRLAKDENERTMIRGYKKDWLSDAHAIKIDYIDGTILENEAISQMEGQYAYYVEKIKSNQKKIPQL